MKLTIFALVACASAISIKRVDPEVASTMESLAESEKDLGKQMGMPISAVEKARKEKHAIVDWNTDDYKTFLREEKEDKDEEMATYDEAKKEVEMIKKQ